MLEDVGDQSLGGDTVGLRFEAEDQTVPQRSTRDRPQVVAGNVEPTLEQRAHLRARDQRL